MKTIRSVTMSFLTLLFCSLMSCNTSEEFNPPTISLGEIIVEVETSTVRIHCTIHGNSEVVKSCGFDYGLTEDLVGAQRVAATIEKGSFAITISDLQPNTKYYYRGYVKYTHEGEQIQYTDIKNFELEVEVSLPALTTAPIASITKTGAVSGGNITNNGGGDITARGVVWGTSENPTIELTTKTVDGKGVGEFTSTLIDLTAGTKYYVRSYATNSIGTAYGEELSFTTTAILLATLTTTDITSITSISETGAVSGGNITNNGGGDITARGVVWSTSENPTIALTSKTEDGEGIGEFTSTITGLTAGTKYYVRAYATNSVGTSYGVQLSFITENVADRTALMALYDATGGANWINKTNWNSESPISTWYGVTVENGSVTQIKLGDNNLVGLIPSGIGNIVQLQILDVSSNKLTSLDISKNNNLLELRCGNQKENKVLKLYVSQAQSNSWTTTWVNYPSSVNSRVNLFLEGKGDNEDSIRDDEYNW